MTARLRSADLLTALLLVVAPSTVGSPSVAVNGQRVRTVDVKHLALDLRFDWTKAQVRGAATITLAPLRPTGRITLDAGMLTIETVTLADGTPLQFRYDGGDRDDGLAITLDRARAAGEELTVRIGYHSNWVNRSDPNNLAGSTGKGVRFFAPTSTEPRKRRQIWSTGVPTGNRYWFPGYDGPDDLRTTEFTATVESPLTAISNGRLVQERRNPDGTATFRWRMDRPYPNQLTSFVVGEYVAIDQEQDGVRLRSYGYPDEAAAVEASVVRLPDMVRFFTERTGRRYPDSSYAQVFVQDHPWGMGNTTAATLTENMVDDARTHADYFYLWDGLEAEALAHQWFGGSLPSRDWRHVWLDRAFAHYFDALYNEHKNGHDNFLLWNLLADQSTYLADWGAGVRHPIVPDRVDDVAAFTADNYSYSRGAAVLHMLRRQLGEDTWWRAIRRYVATNTGRSVSTDDFQRAVEEASGQPMGWFFDQWIYRIGHPAFEVSKRYDDGARELVLTVRQTQRPDSTSPFPQVSLFEGAVDIGIDDRVERVWLAPEVENVFRLRSPTAPRLVQFDVEGTWIKEIEFPKPLDELLHQLRADRDVIGRSWAMGELATLAKGDGTPASDRARIRSAIREVIGGSAQWRLRYGAILQLQGLLVGAGQTGALPLDDSTVATLTAVIDEGHPWLQSVAIGMLGRTRDIRHADRYLTVLRGESHPAIYAAAAALGRTKSPKAFAAFTALMKIPSWKGENVLSGLNGITALGDRRGVGAALAALADDTSSRWTLATPFWDTRLAGAVTLAALGRGSAGFPIVMERFTRAMAENDINDIFSNAYLLATLGDPRGLRAFDLLRVRFKDDADAMVAVDQYQAQLKKALE